MQDFALKVLNAEQEQPSLFFVGQAGFLIKSSGGQLLAVDLYLSECVEQAEGHIGFKRLMPKLFDPFDIRLDYIIATHSHLDHFDMDAMPELMSNLHTKLFASLDCRKLVHDLGMIEDRIIYIKPEETYYIGDFIIHFIVCDHGISAPDAVGVVIEVDGKRVCMVGDTCLRLDWTEKYHAFGLLDILIAPINGAYGNMNEEECAILSSVLKPRLTIPCHFGMFASHKGNPQKFMENMKEICPDNTYLFMCPGEQYIFC